MYIRSKPSKRLLISFARLESGEATWQTQGVWAAAEWADHQPHAPEPIVSPVNTELTAIGEVMQKDPRYAQTIADALGAFYFNKTPAEVDVTTHLSKEEADNIIAVLESLAPKETTPA